MTDAAPGDGLSVTIAKDGSLTIQMHATDRVSLERFAAMLRDIAASLLSGQHETSSHG